MGKVIDIFTKMELNNESLEDITEVTKTSINLKNKYCFIDYDENEKMISGGDFTDPYNEPRFYTKKKRNIKKAWNKVTNEFNTQTKMHDVIQILDSYKLSSHTYCAMD